MSEFQLYEWMAVDKPLTRAQLDAVESLSSHISVSPTYATVDYSWGDFKHDPIKVLQKYFDAFLYQANWGSPQFALRFPHGILPADLLKDYDLDDFVTFTRRADYDILDIQFGEMEGEGEWVEARLTELLPIRDELMEGDLRALYIVWLAVQEMGEGYDEDDDYYDGFDDEEEEEEPEEEERDTDGPPIPPGFGKLTVAQRALAELLRVPGELLDATARHSSKMLAEPGDDFAAWIELLPAARRDDYLLRLASDEPGLSRQLVRELRELGRARTGAPAPAGKRVSYANLATESSAIHAQQERERREREAELERKRLEQERLDRERRLREMHGYEDTYWRQVEKDAARGSASGYDAATQLLVDLRDSARLFDESEAFQERFRDWFQLSPRRPAFLRRLRESLLPVPEA